MAAMTAAGGTCDSRSRRAAATPRHHAATATSVAGGVGGWRHGVYRVATGNVAKAAAALGYSSFVAGR